MTIQTLLEYLLQDFTTAKYVNAILYISTEKKMLHKRMLAPTRSASGKSKRKYHHVAEKF
jgi:hypothetical protein